MCNIFFMVVSGWLGDTKFKILLQIFQDIVWSPKQRQYSAQNLHPSHSNGTELFFKMVYHSFWTLGISGSLTAYTKLKLHFKYTKNRDNLAQSGQIYFCKGTYNNKTIKYWCPIIAVNLFQGIKVSQFRGTKWCTFGVFFI